MKILKLKDKDILLDDEDYDRVVSKAWCLFDKDRSVSNIKIENGIKVYVPISNFIMNDNNSLYDHKNRNPLDNRKENLRVCSIFQNMANRKKFKGGTSKYKGVSWHTETKKWQARINYRLKNIFIGRFKDEQLAAIAYDDKALEIHGEFAVLNFPILYGA